MAELTIRKVDPTIVRMLEQRAQRHHRSVDAEVGAILQDALRSESSGETTMSLGQFLRTMPDVGSDEDFERIPWDCRTVDLHD